MSLLRALYRKSVLFPLLLLAAMAWTGRVGAASLNLNWTDNSGNEDGFKIERSNGGSFTQIAAVGVNVVSYADSGLTDGTTYCYRVRAFNSAGTSSPSNEACANVADSSTSTVTIDSGSSDSSSTSTTSSSGSSFSLTSGSTSMRLETGEVEIDHRWKSVDFAEPFLDPVVVAMPLSYNGSQPAVVRIDNVSSTGFDIRIQEWNYLDDWHLLETVGYVVIERGKYVLGDGTLVEADTFEVDWTNVFGQLPFKQPFNRAPVVLTAVSSFNGSDTVTTRVRNISNQAFEFTMQEQESNGNFHVTETISYIAWEPSAGTIGSLTFEVNSTTDAMNHNWKRIPFDQSFTAGPVFLAGMQTTDGPNTAALRWQKKDRSGVEVKVEEEQSGDRETWHTTEVVGYLALSSE